MNGERERESVFDAYARSRSAGGAGLSVMRLGPSALTFAFFVEESFLVPTVFVENLRRGARITWDSMMAAAWEAVEPLSADRSAGPALGAQLLVALGGNEQRAAADPQRHVRLALAALDSFRGLGLPRHEGRGYLELGRALVAFDRPTDALTAYERARALLERAGDDRGARALHARSAHLLNGLGCCEQALAEAEAGQRVGARLPPVEPAGGGTVGDGHLSAYLHHERVLALTRTGYHREAEAAWEEWRRETPDTSENAFELQASLARLRRQQARHEESLDAYLRAIDARFARLNAASLPVRELYQTNAVTVFGEAIGAAVYLDRPELALALLAALATGPPPGTARTGAPPPATVATALRSLDEEVTRLARRATAVTVARDAGALRACDDRARTLLETRDDLWHEGTRAGRAAGGRTVRELARAIPRAVGPGELALCYLPEGTGRLRLFAVHGGAVTQHVVGLGVEEAARLASAARRECLGGAPPEALRQLGEALLAPVADLAAGASGILVAPSDTLADFPFHAASLGGRPLISRAEVRTLPTPAALAWQAAGGRRATATPPRVVAAGVPRPRYELLPELPAVRAELRTVRAAFPQAGELGPEEATAEAVVAAMASADVLHLAGHATFEAHAPNLARILLADRPLFAFEVAAAPRAPRLVNLSGCRAAAERRTPGGEGEGLAAAFLAAGAEAVIAPLWPVRDDAALAFNALLYRELTVPGARLGEAVRRARLALRARAEFAHPGLWGAFTVLGTL
ncbi:CHAT domain-containing protein [Streptomyces sp. 3MP-14]|uniref:CHAT domain-containing protein n=1 Tax=Streptomyces mimosae TaxID=2586635 RepID=A0A5N6A0E3_9ACTN|nr:MULTISPECIES: CHAT domain-containing protein [Streptomyces]KAB8161995.1 CHAT domain-containing protein [Streptomyces mimosae]KAB8173693.1 CHAT domain-containing protein [Streptomyces sp. 3MP-14]